MSVLALDLDRSLYEDALASERLRVVELDDSIGDSELDHEAGPRLLLAEDDREMRLLLVEELTAAGYRVTAVKNGKELFDYLRRPNFPEPDLVVSDVRMPGLTGLEVLRQLRHHDWAMPVILITAFGDRQTHEEARELGAATVLDKPFDVDELIYAAESVVPAWSKPT